MKGKFTKIMAALALLVFMTPSLVGWGQTTYEQLTSIANIDESAQYVLGIDGTGFHYEGTSSWGKTALPSAQTPIYYTLTKATDGSSFTAQATISGTTYYLQIPTSNTFSMATSTGTNTDIIIGTTQVSETNYAVANKTTTARHLRINGTSGLRSYAGTTGSMAFFYKVVQSTTPTINVTPTSINWNDSPINEELLQVITVSQTNLTGNITASTTIGSITWNTQNESATLVYTPTTEGDFSGTVTFANGETTATVAVTGSAYDPANVDTYELYTGNIVEGDYVIYDASVAMKNEIVSNRFANQAVEPEENQIINPANSIIWHIASSGDYWTIYNAAVEKYAGGTSTKNQGALLDDPTDNLALWAITYNNGFVFHNYGRSLASSDSDNAYLRHNGNSGWATYLSSSGNAPILYKKVNANQVAMPTFTVEAGTYYETKTVGIECSTENANIQYKLTENGEWQDYFDALTISQTTTVWAKATKTGMTDSEVAMATFTIVTIEHAGTLEDPYTVADARNAIDANTGVTGVYATGIVSQVDSYNSNYNSINYWISDDGTTTNQLEAYGGLSGIEGWTFSSKDDITVGATVVIYGDLTKYNTTYEFAANNELVSYTAPTYPIIEVEEALSVAYDATSGEIEYSITNPVEGQSLTATSTAEWISNITVDESAVTFTTTANEGTADRNATITLSYTGATDKVVTVTQGHFVADYATLPFNWAGGTSAALEDLAGVTVNCDPSDYAASNAPYRVKFNEDGHYILIKTNEQPAVVSVGIKKYAAGNTASLTIEGSSDGVTFTEVQSFSITGAQNAVFTYITTNAFATTDRYVRIYYNKPNGGSNVGVGPIIISGIESYPLTITGYASDDTKDGFYLIASPVSVNPATVAGMTEGDFDLYYYDDAEELEWRNYKTSAFNLTPGTGYLYAKKATTENPSYEFTLTGAPYAGQPIQLIQGWNLVGNPYGQIAYITNEYYMMNPEGNDLVPGEGNAIDVMQGIFVNATEAGTMTFSTENNAKAVQQVVMNVTRNRGTAIDRAIVRFDEGGQLPKFQLFESNTKLYIPQGNSDYAIVRSTAEGEMPVNFKARENGTYTISVNTENVEMDYLHLIDNMTGNDVDLLSTPSYTFEATTRDYASRFRLTFSANEPDGPSTGSGSFAYFNGSEWQISNVGEATLQVVDVMGRIVKNVALEGNATVSINEMPGVYMMRLLNGNDVKVQKVVIR